MEKTLKKPLVKPAKPIITPNNNSIKTPKPEPQVVVGSPEQNLDSRYILIPEIPSNYHPRFNYPFKQLWIRQFTAAEARLIHMARISNNLSYLLRAVDACLDQSVYSLIVEDFEYCLYWLRLNSYPNKPVYVTWECDNAIKKDAIVKGKKQVVDKECGFKQSSQIKKTSLEITSIPDSFILPKDFAFPTVAFMLEFDELKREIEDLEAKFEDPTIEDDYNQLIGDLYLAGLAQWLKDGETLKDKIEILKNYPSLDLQERLEEFSNNVPSFGVSESIELKCQECGGETRRKLVIDYLSFFP